MGPLVLAEVWLICSVLLLLAVVFGILFVFMPNKNNHKMLTWVKSQHVRLQKIPQSPTTLTSVKDELYMFNPSIAIDPNSSDIVVLARIAGKSRIPQKMWCDQSAKDFTSLPEDIEGLENYFSMFEHNKPLSSGIVKYTTTKAFDKQTNPKIVNPFVTKKNGGFGLEDPRVFTFRKRLWCIAYLLGKNFPFETDVDTSSQGHYVIMFPLDDFSQTKLLDFPEHRFAIEKNWMPFEHNEALYIVYSINPHTILQVDVDTGFCTQVYETTDSNLQFAPKIGNGAPAQLIQFRGQQPMYLGAAHTSETSFFRQIRKPFFYLFSASPPFEIIQVGKPFDLINKEILIEFPSGLIVDNDTQTAILSFGVNDCFNGFKSFSFEEVGALLM